MSGMQDPLERAYYSMLDAAKRMNAAMEAALTKVAQRFNADDWDTLTHPEHKDNHEPEKA